MVVVRYSGLINPTAEMEALRTYNHQLQALMMRCRPFGPDYCALLEAKEA